MRSTYHIRYTYQVPMRNLYTTGFCTGHHPALHRLWASVFIPQLEIVKYEVIAERFLV